MEEKFSLAQKHQERYGGCFQMCDELSDGRGIGICLLWVELETNGKYPLQVGICYLKSEIFHVRRGI